MSRLIRVWLPVATGAGVLALALVLTIHSRSASPRPPSIEAVRAPTVVSTGQETDLTELHSTPSLAVDLADRDHVVVVDRIDLPQTTCRVHATRDGGTTWKGVGIEPPSPPGSCIAPDVAMGPNSTPYLVFASLPKQPPGDLEPGGAMGVFTARSGDRGNTFATPVRVAASNASEPRVSLDPRDGTIYVVYTETSPTSPVDPTARGVTGLRIMVSSSSDEGASYSRPAPVSDPDDTGVGDPRITITANGGIVILYRAVGPSRPGTSSPPNQKLEVARSADRGHSFVRSVVDASVVPPDQGSTHLSVAPSLAAAPDGRDLYVAWSDARDGSSAVLLRRSGDGGETWSKPVHVTPSRELRSSGMPAMAARSNHVVDVAFLTSTGRERINDIEMAFSTDGGKSFNAASAVARDIGGDAGATESQLSRLAIGSAGGHGTLVAWIGLDPACRGAPCQDLFVTMATGPALPKPAPRAK